MFFMNKKIINRYIKRVYASIGKWMGVLLLPLLLFSSCVDESVTSASTTSSDSTQVRLTFNLQQQTSLTRSLSSTGTSESQVDNINVLIFDSNGKLIGSTYQTYGTSQTSSFTVTVPTRVASSCTIYAVANLPSDSLKNVATVSDFNKKFILMSSAATLGNGSNMTMFGQTSSVTISSTASSNTPSITLTRLGSKVTFNITPATGITITGYQLCHVPMSSYITSATDSTHFNPSATYGNLDAVSNLSSTTIISPTFYTYENLVGRKSGATSYFSRNASNAPTDATYLLIYAQQRDSCWHAIYRIYLGGSGTNDYANYNIYRNYNCTYNIHIDGADAVDVRVTYSVPKIGDYYYSDGNWSDGTVAPISGKTVIGVVFQNNASRMSTTEINKGWTHGYVVAITEVSSSGIWGNNLTDAGLSKITSDQLRYQDLSGYSNTQALGDNTNYPVFYYAKRYGTSYTSSLTYAAPTVTNNSGWYMPSAGQWWDLLQNLGGINLSSYTTNTADNVSISGGGTTIINNLNTIMNKFSGTTFTTNSVYSVASEYSAPYCCDVYFNTSGDLSFGQNYKNLTGRKIRCILAF